MGNGSVRRGVLAAVAVLPVLAAACTSGGPDQVGGTAAPVGSTAAASAPPTTSAAPTVPTASSAPAPTATSAPGSRTAAPGGRTATPTAGPLPAGGYDVLVTAVDTARGTISVDVVDFLTGDAAVRACREDGGRGSGESCRNGHVRNTATPVRTLMMATNARITMSRAVAAQPATLAAVAAGLPARNLYSMRMGFDSVSRLDEIYRP